MLHVERADQEALQVPVPQELIDELEAEFSLMSRPRSVKDESNEDVAILGRFAKDGMPLPWSNSGLSKSIRAFVRACARQLHGKDALQLERVTTRWLRPTHVVHLLTGRDDQEPVPLSIIVGNLGPAAVTATRLKLSVSDADRIVAMRGFWGEGKTKRPGNS